jgi:hypothetical protein
MSCLTRGSAWALLQRRVNIYDGCVVGLVVHSLYLPRPKYDLMSFLGKTCLSMDVDEAWRRQTDVDL